MSQSISIPHHRAAEGEPRLHHHLLVGAVLGLIVGALGFAILESTVGFVRAALPTQAAIAETLGEPSREWRWERDSLSLDNAPAVPAHVRRFRYPEDGAAAGGLEWIRDSGRRPR